MIQNFVPRHSSALALAMIIAEAVMFSGCQKKSDPAPVPPTEATVTTAAVLPIGSTYAIGRGEVVSEGGAPVTVAGLVWSTEPGPTVDLPTKTSGISGKGGFSANIAFLNILTKYYVRAYATNAVGTAYGNEVNFTTTSKGSCQIAQYTLSQSDINGSFQFTYDAEKRVDLVSGSFGGYKYRYSGDSVYINTFYQGSVLDLVYTSASSGGKVQSIKRYFSSTGGVYRYTFDYSVNSQVTIILDYFNISNPSVTQNDMKGVYLMDPSGNVTRWDVYIPNSVGDWVLQQTSTYTYDKTENSVQGLIIPFLSNQGVPKPYYFSTSNVLIETTGANVVNYNILYSVEGLPLEVAPATSSPVMRFAYVSCPF